MMRGELVTIAIQGDFGEPRAALVIQADLLNAHVTVTVLPVTSTLVDAPLIRILVQPSTENGLPSPSQILVDKVMTVKRDIVRKTLDRIDAVAMVEVERCLAVFLGIAK
ncbi:MAG: type II toxin-antitoxin system PemK/MazF family toxin [Xanthomonadales bacterium]|nr:type II toxin-antitoxin system PemK/MazF family toxin [Xanthomonadales bacterium]